MGLTTQSPTNPYGPDQSRLLWFSLAIPQGSLLAQLRAYIYIYISIDIYIYMICIHMIYIYITLNIILRYVTSLSV